jgi:basic membrane protein A and related proteins
VRKRALTLVALAAATVLLASLFAAMRGSTASAAHKATFSACLVTDIGGLNDKSFNHLAFVGLQLAEKRGIKGRVIQSKSPADYIPNLKACVTGGASITIGVGFLMADAMDAIATSYKTNKFAIVDVDATGLKHKPKNVEGLLFKEQEAGYLVGYAAGMYVKATHGKAVGSIGGLKIPPVDRFIAGYYAGAKRAGAQVQVTHNYSQDFVDQAKCKEQALGMIANGAGVVFQVAGQCGLGVLSAAKEKGVFGIGVDADQGYLGAHVMTSATKKVDVAVYQTIEAAKRTRAKFRTNFNAIFTVANGGVGYGKISSRIAPNLKAQVEAVRKLLAAGKIKNIPQAPPATTG